MSAAFRFASDWSEMLNRIALTHDGHGETEGIDWAGAVPLLEDRDRYLEDFLLQNVTNAGGTTSRASTIVVAASNSSTKSKAGADYTCTGTNDETTLASAITALPSMGGKVLLLEGDYHVSTATTLKSNATVEGMGAGTVIHDDLWAGGTALGIFEPPASTAVNNARIANLHFAITSQFAYCVSSYNTGATWNWSSFEGLVLDATAANRMASVNLLGGGHNRIVGATTVPGGSARILITDGSYNLIANNVLGVPITGVINDCISLTSSAAGGGHNTVVGNVIDGFTEYGILIQGLSGKLVTDNLVMGNVIRNFAAGAGLRAIMVKNFANTNTVQANTVRKGSGTNDYAIEVATGATDNFVTNNDLKAGYGIAGILDNGTGTITAAGNRT